MSLKLLLDMNLSPDWILFLQEHGWEAVHWSSVGNPQALDDEIMFYAVENGYAVFTHDLDFGMLLALTKAEGPSVIQVRVQDVSPGYLGKLVLAALETYATLLEAGVLIIIDEHKMRARILPLTR